MSLQSEYITTGPTVTSAPSDSFIDACRTLRAHIKAAATHVHALHAHAGLTMADTHQREPAPDRDEAHANVQLAYRHLEDAAMRLGKAIQAFDGGVSVYDK